MRTRVVMERHGRGACKREQRWYGECLITGKNRKQSIDFCGRGCDVLLRTNDGTRAKKCDFIRVRKSRRRYTIRFDYVLRRCDTSACSWRICVMRESRIVRLQNDYISGECPYFFEWGCLPSSWWNFGGGKFCNVTYINLGLQLL